MPQPIKNKPEKIENNNTQNNLFMSFNCAIQGVIYTFKTQRSMRIHFLIALIVLIICLFVNLDRTDFIIVISAIVLVMLTEILNTVVEHVGNMVSKKNHPVVKNIKDMAAGMVLLTSIYAVIVGYLIFFKKQYFGYNMTIPVLIKVREAPEYVVIICLAILLILIIAGKSFFGKGMPLRGGMPSFHSAFAFAVATMTAFITRDVILTGMTLIIAVIVAESRYREGIHSKLEIVIGAIVGILITTLMFQVFS